MDDACEKEQARLVQRTTELAERTKALSLSSHPFSEDEHDALLAEVHQLQSDMADFERRCLDKAD